MKIVWFGHKARERGNGLITYSKEIPQGLRQLGHELVFFYHGKEDVPDHNGVRIGSFNVFNHDIISSPSARAMITRRLQEEDVSVAHVSLSFSLLDFSLPEICHDLGIPIVGTFHFPYDRRLGLWSTGTRALYRLYARPLARYDAVIVFSEEQRALLDSYGLPADRIAVIPNGVDIKVFSPGPSGYRDEIGAALLTTYCGRVDPEKNVGALLESWCKLDLPADHKIVVVGVGADFERLAQRYGTNEQVIFTGLITDRERLVKILQATDIFVLPSEVEGLSLSMLEAMACGNAVIATDVGSDGEALRGAGLLLDPKQLAGQLPLALDTLVRFPSFRQELARLARRRVEERYSLESNLQSVLNLYDQVLRQMERQTF